MARIKLRNGRDHHLKGEDNFWHCRPGDTAEYDFGKPVKLSNVRLVFDSDLHRQARNSVANYWLNAKTFEIPDTIADAFEIIADGKTVLQVTGNYQRLVNIPLDITTSTITLKITSFAGKGNSGSVCSFDVQ